MSGKSSKTGGPMSGIIAKYATSIVAKQALGVVNAYLKPLLLSPVHYGLWNLLNTVLNFTALTHLGSRSAMRFRIPANEANGDDKANRRVTGAVFFGTMCLTGLAVLGLGASAALLDFDMPERLGLATMALVMAIAWLAEFHVANCKARSTFTPIISANYLKAVAACVLNVALILALGVYGLFLALILTHVLVLWFLRRNAPKLDLGHFDPRLFLELIREGFPIVAFSLGAMLIRTADRFIISAWLGLEALGYYGIAIMALNFLMRIPDASREVVEPRLMKDLQTRPEDDCLRDYVARPLLATSYGLPLLLGPAMLLAPAAVELLLPRYVLGVPAAQALIAGSLFLAQAFVLRGIIVARGLQVRATCIMLIAVAANLGLSAALLALGLGILGVALASSCSFLLLFGSLWLFMRSREAAMPLASPLELFGPLALAVAAVGAQSAAPVPAIVSGPAACALFLFLAVPLYNRAGRRTGYWKPMTVGTLKQRFKR